MNEKNPNPNNKNPKFGCSWDNTDNTIDKSQKRFIHRNAIPYSPNVAEEIESLKSFRVKNSDGTINIKKTIAQIYKLIESTLLQKGITILNEKKEKIIKEIGEEIIQEIGEEKREEVKKEIEEIIATFNNKL